ncbi:MAG TPA: di-trans,poly-cis-decaprenylcistransferase [Caulobacteraceae bacterium]|jgi:undecaprenyl diphosphate synthase
MQSHEPFHVAIIMDGNGRWGVRQGACRADGHRAGVEAVRRVVEAAPDLGVNALTLYAFSSDNWRRPQAEVETLMGLFRAYLASDGERLVREGARLTMLGRRDRLPADLAAEVARIEAASAANTRMRLRIALDYSSRAAIAEAARALGPGASVEDLDRLVLGPDAGPVDLLIRTGGEQRLSDFMLWECAYAELWFCERMWPSFGAEDLAAAIADFRRRSRRFGGLSKSQAQSANALPCCVIPEARAASCPGSTSAQRRRGDPGRLRFAGLRDDKC